MSALQDFPSGPKLLNSGRRRYTSPMSVLVSVRFVIQCSFLRRDALGPTANPYVCRTMRFGALGCTNARRD